MIIQLFLYLFCLLGRFFKQNTYVFQLFHLFVVVIFVSNKRKKMNITNTLSGTGVLDFLFKLIS